MRTSFYPKYYILFTILLCISSCTGNTSTTSTTETNKYDRTPYAVYTYDGSKEIVLFDSPKTAIVNGKSGAWTIGHDLQVNGELFIEEEYYIVRYGTDCCIISMSKEMIYWGTEQQAIDNWGREERWVICHKKRH